MSLKEINLAIVEDEKTAKEKVTGLIERYSLSHNVKIRIDHFYNAVNFLESYRSGYDIILMDIELPGMDGMKASRKLRARDENVIIIFVTNMAQFAVKGYEVSALDFIVKPVLYGHLEQVFDRALKIVESKKKEHFLRLYKNDAMVLINVRDLSYVEVVNHTLLFHKGEEVYAKSGTLGKIEKELAPYGFAMCKSCYLVNLKKVDRVDGFSLEVDGAMLQISHPKKKSFMAALAKSMSDAIEI